MTTKELASWPANDIVTTPTDRATAEDRARDINERLGSLAEHINVIPVLVIEAKAASDHIHLGYKTFDEYVKAKFETNLIKVERALRRHWAHQLKGEGFNQREIAAVTNVDQKTVSNDLRGGEGEENSSKPKGTKGAKTKPVDPGAAPNDADDIYGFAVDYITSASLGDLKEFRLTLSGLATKADARIGQLLSKAA